MGSFWFILPVKQAELLIEKAKAFHFVAHKIIELHSDDSKTAFRYIVNLSKRKANTETDHFYIYESEKKYTKAYKTLLKDFFLDY